MLRVGDRVGRAARDLAGGSEQLLKSRAPLKSRMVVGVNYGRWCCCLQKTSTNESAEMGWCSK